MASAFAKASARLGPHASVDVLGEGVVADPRRAAGAPAREGAALVEDDVGAGDGEALGGGEADRTPTDHGDAHLPDHRVEAAGGVGHDGIDARLAESLDPFGYRVDVADERVVADGLREDRSGASPGAGPGRGVRG